MGFILFSSSHSHYVTVNSEHYTASNGKVTHKWWIKNDVQGNGHDL